MMEPRSVQFADGLWGMEITRTELPPHLSREEHMGRIGRCYPDGTPCRPLLEDLQVTRQSPVRVRGIRRACLDDQHTTDHWLSGRFHGLDVALLVCSFCWRVQVRDVSLDILVDQAPDGRRLRMTPKGLERRKNAVLGLYSGARPLGRVYL